MAAAADYITTHRGAVSSGPRALLAEAQRELDQALALAPSDRATARQGTPPVRTTSPAEL